MKRDTKRNSLLALAVASGLMIQVIIWLPEVAHYHVNDTPVSTSVVDSAISAQDRWLDGAIRQIDFGLKGDLSEVQAVLTAENMLNGKLDFPGFDMQEVSWPFDETYLLLGGPTFQLKMAGLAWVELALDAWQLSGDDKFLDFAFENTLLFAHYESGQFLPTGYLWNDHALANRAIVYARLWGALASTKRLDRASATELLSAVNRTAKLLAKPAHYTYRTNHGVMQNLGLIAIAAAFPWLDRADEYFETGYERLARQMDFFVSRQGAVLEHSTSYHEFGASLLSAGFSLLERMSEPVPVSWRDKVQRSKELLRMLARPDNSIPNFGDSQANLGNAGREILEEAHDSPGYFDSLEGLENSDFVDAGYAIYRAGLESQSDLSIHSVATWSKFVSNAHKHADELSVDYWVNGTSLWRGSGYWPYGLPYRDVATGWSGSNAPHLLGERANSERLSFLAGAGEIGRLSAWELRRRGENDYSVSRLVILSRDGWALVVDATTDPMSRWTESIWATAPYMKISSRTGKTAVFEDTRSGLSIGVAVDSPASLELDLLRGSTEPFAGWVASNGRVEPSWAMRIVAPTNSGIATAWGLLSADSTTASVVETEIAEWSGEEHWSADVFLGDTRIGVERIGSTLIFSNTQDTPFKLEIREPGLDQSLSAEVAAYLEEASVPDTYRDYLPWRWMVSEYCLYFFLGLLIAIVLIPKRLVSASFKPGAFAIVAGSSLLGTYIHFVYFAV